MTHEERADLRLALTELIEDTRLLRTALRRDRSPETLTGLSERLSVQVQNIHAWLKAAEAE